LEGLFAETAAAFSPLEVHMSLRNVFLSLASLAVLGIATPAAAQTLKIGIVDVQRAVVTVKDGVTVKAKLERLLKDKQKDFDKMQEDVKRLKDELETQGAMMKEDLRRQKIQDYQKKMVELQEFYMGNQRELADKEAELTAPILERLEKVLVKLGKDEGFTVILNASATLYNADAIDLTDRLIKLYDAGAGK
jgi:outer membrane protein